MNLQSHYQKHGYVVVEGLLKECDVDKLSQVTQRWVDYMIDVWVKEGLLTEKLIGLDFQTRFLQHWEMAGKPQFRRAPYFHMINKEIYQFLTSAVVLDVIEKLLESGEISVHGIFNTRFKFPGENWTTTPWHQDGQFYTSHGELDAERCYSAHVVTVWVPLQDVKELQGCLKVASVKQTEGKVFPLGDSPENWMPHSIVSNIQPQILPMKRGDVLFFNQKLAHASTGNTTDKLLWSVDVRYESTENLTVSGQKYGLIARSRTDPDSETSLNAWLSKREKSPQY